MHKYSKDHMFALYHVYTGPLRSYADLVLMQTCLVDLCFLSDPSGQRHASAEVWGSLIQLYEHTCTRIGSNVAYCQTQQVRTE